MSDDKLEIGNIRITKESEDTDIHDGMYYRQFPCKVQRVTIDDPYFDEAIVAHMSCNHVNIVTVLAVEKSNSYHFVALEMFDYTLEDYLQKHRISTPESMDILRGVFSGVFYLHNTKSIVHRNLRTSNVMIRRGDSPMYTPMLGVMGRSKRLTEQDKHSDLYDLAVMLLRCVSFKDDPKQITQEDERKWFDDKMEKIKETYPEAYNLIWRLANEPKSIVNISEVLRDPFFWNLMKRMFFLMHASEFVNKVKNSGVRRVADGYRVDIFGDLGWQKKVDKSWLKRVSESGGYATNYQDTVSEFLRLVRNTISHILENTPDDYTLEELDGYLRQKYPNLVPTVYKLLQKVQPQHIILKRYL